MDRYKDNDNDDIIHPDDLDKLLDEKLAQLNITSSEDQNEFTKKRMAPFPEKLAARNNDIDEIKEDMARFDEWKKNRASNITQAELERS